MKEDFLKGLDEYVGVRYIEPENARFERTPGGFLSLQIDPNENYTRVNLYRAFPFTNAGQYISVRDTDGKEIGVIRSIIDFPPRTVALLYEDINRRYFTPVIKKIDEIKEEFGYSYWEVETNAGHFRFTVKGGHHSITTFDEERITIVDIDGNRYEINNVLELDDRSYRKLEAYL